MDQEYDPKVWDGSQKRTKLTVDQQKGIWEERRLRATKNVCRRKNSNDMFNWNVKLQG